MLLTHTAAEHGFGQVWSVRVCFVELLQKSLTLMTTNVSRSQVLIHASHTS
jgi:hypothetical protein